MPSFRELLAQTKARITEIRPSEAETRLGDATFLDVREQDEYDAGTVPGAIHIPAASSRARSSPRSPTTTRPSSSTAPAAPAPRSRPRRSKELGYYRRRVDGRRLRAVEERGPPVDHARRAHRRAA